MTTAMLLHEWLLAISAEQWPGYRDAYLQAQKALPGLGFDARAERPVPASPGGIAVVPMSGALSRRGDPWTDMLGWTTYEGLASTMRTLAADRIPQPGFGEGPKSLALAQRNSQSLDCFGHAHADEVAQLHQPGRVGVHLRELIQHFVQRQQFSFGHAQLNA